MFTVLAELANMFATIAHVRRHVFRHSRPKNVVVVDMWTSSSLFLSVDQPIKSLALLFVSINRLGRHVVRQTTHLQQPYNDNHPLLFVGHPPRPLSHPICVWDTPQSSYKRNIQLCVYKYKIPQIPINLFQINIVKLIFFFN